MAGARGEGTAIAAARLWEQAARAGVATFDVEGTLAYVEHASELYELSGQAWAAARANNRRSDVAARRPAHRSPPAAHRRLGGAAPDPDADTVTVLNRLAVLETFAGGAEADGQSTEALALGQALDVDAGLLADLFISPGSSPALRTARRRGSLTWSTRPGSQSGLATAPGKPVPCSTWPTFSTSRILSPPPRRPARTADLARHDGNIAFLSVAIGNEAEALLFTGSWDDADRILHGAIDVDQLGLFGYMALTMAFLAALRGDVEAASSYLDLRGLSASEDAQEQAHRACCEAFLAVARNQGTEALRHARTALAHAPRSG